MSMSAVSQSAGKPYPEPFLHPPQSMVGIPYYDEEFALAQSRAHAKTVLSLGPKLQRVAEQAGLCLASDNPIWYWIVEENKQKALYPDLAITHLLEIDRLTANDLCLAVEVVSRDDARKERKDSQTMRQRNEYHEVPEFLLVYPELDDPRALRWFRYELARGGYRELTLVPGHRHESQAIAGLALEIMPQHEWREGQKLRVYYQGRELREAAVEAQARERAERQAAQERQRAEQADQRAEQAESENVHLLALLKQAGIDPTGMGAA